MGAIVVQDQMHVQVARHGPLDLAQERKGLLMPVTVFGAYEFITRTSD